MFFFLFLISLIFLIIGLSYFLPFLKERPSVRLVHSKLRIFLLFLFLIAFPIFLVFAIFYRTSIDGWRIVAFWLTNKPLAISYSLSLLFVFLTGIMVPAVTVFHFFFSYKLFLRRHEYEEIQAGSSGDDVLMELKDLFSECARIAGVKRTIRFLVVKSEAGEMSKFSGCGIVGKGKKLALVVGSDFVDAYRSGKLDKENIRNIFLHEISHVKNRDCFFPLWARQMVRTRAFTFAVVSFLVALLFMVATIAFTSRGIATIKKNLWVLVALPVVVPSTLFIIKAVVLSFIGSIMREREYLADNCAAFSYSTPEGVANAIKKSALLLPNQGDFSASLPFHGSLGKMKWHPSELERIEALGLRKGPPSRKVKPISPLTMVALNLLYAGILGFLVLAWALPGANEDIFVIMALLLSFTFILVMATENVFPMRFLEKEVFQEGLIGYGALRSFSLFFTSKLWGKIHLNNFVTALTICSLTALSSFIFFRKGAYIQWHRAFFPTAVLVYFLFCTVLSIILVAVYWREKKKPPRKGEVPLEMVVE